jgi:Lipase (class 3)
MSNDSKKYNNGSYDFQQQTFCLSMLTCLSFNLTGRSADAICKKFKTAVENVLSNDAAKELIGTWKLVWGPVVYADAFIGAQASVNSMFIAAPAEHPEQVVIAIAGTNGNSLVGWMIEDFNVEDTIPWPYGKTSLKPHISKGVAYGLGKLQHLAEKNTNTNTEVTAEDYLAAHPSITQIMVTGHSLGGALAPLYSLYLEDTKPDWNPSGLAAISCLATAGQTSGNVDFSKYYGERLASSTCRVWNSMDIVPHAFQKNTLAEIPTLYEPQIPSQQRIEKLIARIQQKTEANHYLNIMPEVEGFSSSYMTLEDLAGDKYKNFVDLINSVVNFVSWINLFKTKSAIGYIEFIVHALIQHIFPYFNYFKINEFIAVMNFPTSKTSPPSEPNSSGS